MESRERLELQLLLLTLQCLALPLVTQVIAVCGFVIGLGLSWWHFPLALAVTLVLSALWHRRVWPLRGSRDTLLVSLVFLLLLAVGIVLGMYLPVSPGSDAALLRIDALAAGLNPLRESMGAGNGENGLGSMIFHAELLLSGAGVLAGRGLHLVLLVAAWASSLVLVRRLEPPTLALRVALVAVAVLNPVAVCSLGHCGPASSVASLLTTGLWLSTLWLRLGRRWLLPVAAACWAVLPSFGLAFLPVTCLGVLGTIWLTRHRRRELTGTASSWLLAAGLAGFILAVLPLLGPTPLDRSWLQALDLTHGRTPETSSAFLERNRVSRLTLSLGATSLDGCEELPGLNEPICLPKWKIPGLLHREELGSFLGRVPRYGGFGPLFSLGLLASLLVFLAGLRGLSREARGWSLMAVGGVAVSILVAADAWWAPLAPQLWVAPLVLIGPVLLRDTARPPWRRPEGLSACLALGVLLGDAVMVALPGLLVAAAGMMTRLVEAQLFS